MQRRGTVISTPEFLHHTGNNGFPPRSFFAVAVRFARSADTSTLQACQAQLEALGLRYCLSSQAGRWEFFSDLITAGHHLLSVEQKKALQYHLFSSEIDHGPEEVFVDFSRDYLMDAMKPSGGFAGAHARDRISAGPISKVLAALSLAGMLAAGCSPKKQTTVVSPPQLTTGTGLQSHTPPVCRYIVRPGDSVYSIAKSQGVDAAELVRVNNLSYNQKRGWYVLHPGQELILPEKKHLQANAQDRDLHEPMEAARTIGGGIYHLVHKGETLGTIAKKYNSTIKEIAAANNIENPACIRYGTLLKIPRCPDSQTALSVSFQKLSIRQKIAFLQERTIPAGRPYLPMLVRLCEQFNVDPRLYAALVWEESWFDHRASSQDNCQRLVQLDPRFHEISHDVRENFQKSLRYLRYEFIYYLKQGFDRKAATICAIAAYNGGNTRIRRFIKNGTWDGRNVATIPIRETREYVARVLRRCEHNYHAIL